MHTATLQLLMMQRTDSSISFTCSVEQKSSKSVTITSGTSNLNSADAYAAAVDGARLALALDAILSYSFASVFHCRFLQVPRV
jgi:hypothetical protein